MPAAGAAPNIALSLSRQDGDKLVYSKNEVKAGVY